MIKYDISNDEYHGDKGFLSSSQLKKVLKSPDLFYQEEILGRKKDKDSPAMKIGRAVHSKILEPHLYDKEFVLYTGSIRKGKEWEAFAEEHKGKTILSDKEFVEVTIAVDNILNTDSTLPYINGGKPEVSVFTELDGVKVKARADYLNRDLSYIQDIKTTSELINKVNVQKIIAYQNYDLSAALYLDAFRNAGYNLKRFVWIFTSKNYPSCKIFEASPAMIENGRIKYKRALELVKRYQGNNWNLSNEIIEVDPIEYDVQSRVPSEENKELW